MTSVGILGAGGYLGRNLCAELAAEGACRVTALDLEQIPGVPAADFRSVDVTDPETLSGTLDGLDVVFYRVGLKGPAPSFDRPIAFQETNVQGLLNVAAECLHAGVDQLVYDSSESVFGPSDEPPFAENQPPTPNTIYGAAKAAAEDYLRRLAADTDLATVVFRYPRVVGGDGTSVITRMAEMISAGEAVTITASGAKRFDLVHLRDVLRWNRWCIAHPRWSGTLHVSCGEAFTATEVARAVADELSRPLRSEVTDERSENDRLLPDHAELATAASRRRTGLGVEAARLEELVAATLAGRSRAG